MRQDRNFVGEFSESSFGIHVAQQKSDVGQVETVAKIAKLPNCQIAKVETSQEDRFLGASVGRSGWADRDGGLRPIRCHAPGATPVPPCCASLSS